ncbi:MAG TPA: glycosyltransferase family 39 protein, partial [Chloroflexota bacterium]|nr:glycosyltransferase family 39 protein [Chloroflexota bacterium]
MMRLDRRLPLPSAAWWGLGILPLVALLARLAYVATLPPQIVITFEADPLTYDQIARNIVAGRGFTGASFYYPPGTEHPTAFWDALYPYFLAALYGLFGHSVPLVRVVQAVLGAGAVALTFVVGRQLARPAVGLVAAAVSAVYPFFIYYTGQLLTETLFMALILAVFAAGFRAVQTRAALWFMATGVLTGLAALCRAEAFYIGVAFLLWIGWRASKLPLARLRLASLALVAMLAVMFPWGIRNQLTHGQFILTTTKLGYNLYKYYHPMMTADQTVAVVPFPDFGARTEPQREALLRELGLGFMRADPARTLWFMANKLVLLFKLTPSNEVNRQYALLSLASYGVLLPFMALGGWLALRRRGRFLPVLAYVLFSVATKAAVFAGIRLRMQIEPFLLLLAALAIVALGERLAARLPPVGVPR